MKPRLLLIALLVSLLVPVFTNGQQLLNNQSTVSERDRLIYSLKYAQTEPDTFEFNYQKSPGLAFAMSAVLPGSGEFYAGAKYRAAAFIGVEIVSWIVYFNRRNTGQKIEDDYIKWANSHWSAYNWWANSLPYPGIVGLSDSSENFGSHLIYFEYEGKEYKAEKTYLNNNLPGWDSYLLNGDLIPVKTRDYYENIGKYDQFASGWDDFDEITANIDTSNVKNSPHRSKYVYKRYDSNQALKMATNFATVIMFNHLISAFHAQIVAKQYRSPEEKDFSWQVGLVTEYTQKNPIRGMTLSLAF